MPSLRSDNEAACLEVAIDLFERSDAYAETEPRIARQYARQAYELAQRSQSLRHSIVRERIRMIVKHSERSRLAAMMDRAPKFRAGRLRYLGKVGILTLLALISSFFLSTPIDDLPNERVRLAAQFIDAPL